MSTKADYTDEEWTTLRRAPLVAGLAISIADPSGPVGAVKESMGSLKTITGQATGGEGLVGAVAADIQAQARERHNPLGDFKVEAQRAGEQVLGELRRANEIVSAKATPEEATAFRTWLVSSAQAAAEAAKEGGFMGFGGERVSEGEQRMLDEVGRAVGQTGA